MKKFFAFLAIASLTLAGCDKTPVDSTIKVESVSVNPETLTLEVGQSRKIIANVSPEDADNSKVTWTTSAADIANVDATTGEITAIAKGDATITATTEDGGKTDFCTVTVVPANIPGEVTISGDGFDISQRQTIVLSEADDAVVKVKIASARAIDKLLVEIGSSSSLFEAVLTHHGLDTEFDLADPTDELLATFTEIGVGLPSGADVKGQTEVTLDISAFIPLIFDAAGECTADFKITAIDDSEVSDTETLKLGLEDDTPAVVSISGDGFDIEEPMTIMKSEAASADVDVNVVATRGIDSFRVKVSTNNAMLNMLLGYVGLTSEFDLANPSDDFMGNVGLMETLLEGPFPFPYGDDAKGKTELTMNVSSLVPFLFGTLDGGEAAIEIEMTVSDALGNSDSKTANISLVDDTVQQASVSIEGDGFDIEEPMTIKKSEASSANIKAKVTATGGIDKFLVKISTDNFSLNIILGMVSLNQEFDLANPTQAFLALIPTMEDILGMPFPYPYGDDMKGETEVTFDIGVLAPKLFTLFNGNANLEITLNVSDAEGNSDSKTAEVLLDGSN